MDNEDRTFVVVDAGEACPTDEECPECGAMVLALWSGVKCSRCPWWHCA